MQGRLLLLISFAIMSCKQGTQQTGTNSAREGTNWDIRQELKQKIFAAARNYEPDCQLFDVTFTRLNTSTVLYIRPVIYVEYIEKGVPLSYFMEQNRLFLIYSGLDEIVSRNDPEIALIRSVYDSACRANNIGSIDRTYDKPPLFMRIDGDTLHKYEYPGYDMQFYEKTFH